MIVRVENFGAEVGGLEPHRGPWPFFGPYRNQVEHLAKRHIIFIVCIAFGEQLAEVLTAPSRPRRRAVDRHP